MVCGKLFVVCGPFQMEPGAPVENSCLPQQMIVDYSGASTYKHPDIQPIRVTTSSGRKILLRLATGASSYELEKKVGKVGNLNCFQLNVGQV